MSYLILNKGIATALGRVSINTWYVIEPIELKDGRYAVPKDAISGINRLAVKDAKKANAAINTFRTAIEVENIDDLLINYDEVGNPINRMK
jgi:hypothetical protein